MHLDWPQECGESARKTIINSVVSPRTGPLSSVEAFFMAAFCPLIAKRSYQPGQFTVSFWRHLTSQPQCPLPHVPCSLSSRTSCFLSLLDCACDDGLFLCAVTHLGLWPSWGADSTNSEFPIWVSSPTTPGPFCLSQPQDTFSGCSFQVCPLIHSTITAALVCRSVLCVYVT